MEGVEKHSENHIDKLKDAPDFKEGISRLEDAIRKSKGSFEGDTPLCPLKHMFSENMYVRQISIPAGTVLTGKIHKHQHPNFLMSGEVVVITEGRGKEYLIGPLAMISDAGTKRALIAKTDLVWITVHENPTNTRDLKELEEQIIAKDFDDFAKYVESKKSPVRKLKNYIIKKLL